MPGSATYHLIFWPSLTAFLMVSLRCWIWLFYRWQNGLPILRQENYAPKPWGVVDVLLAVAFMFGFVTVAVAAFLNDNDLTEMPKELPVSLWTPKQIYSSAGVVIALVASILLVALRYGFSLAHFGVQWRQLSRDIATGVVAFFAAAPFVYGLNMIVSLFVEPNHQLIKMVERDPTPRTFLVVVFAAVVLAPLAEEFWYRLILQGWIEKAFRLRHVEGSAASWGLLVGGEPKDDETKAATPQHLQGPTAWMPTIITAAVFALLHLGQGAAPIPLFFFALLLGFLFQRTGRITPSVVVHLLLNSFTSLLLLLQMLTTETDPEKVFAAWFFW